MLKQAIRTAAAGVLSVPLGLLDFAIQCEVEEAWARYARRHPDVTYYSSSPNPLNSIARTYRDLSDYFTDSCS